MPQRAIDFERYFRDPRVGDNVLGVGSSGLACKNIRLALRFLDFHESIEFSETYDAALAHEILRFQEAYKHNSCDGQVGPGTRSALTRALLDKVGEVVFSRMQDPERRDLGQVFVSYARIDSSPVRGVVELVRSWGFNVWYDDNISGGEYFNASIQRAIEDCYLTLVCLSEASVHSEWVVKEVMFANNAKKAILPVKVGPLPATHPLQLVLVNHQMLDTCNADFLDRLKMAIESVHLRSFQN